MQGINSGPGLTGTEILSKYEPHPSPLEYLPSLSLRCIENEYWAVVNFQGTRHHDEL